MFSSLGGFVRVSGLLLSSHLDVVSLCLSRYSLPVAGITRWLFLFYSFPWERLKVHVGTTIDFKFGTEFVVDSYGFIVNVVKPSSSL